MFDKGKAKGEGRGTGRGKGKGVKGYRGKGDGFVNAIVNDFGATLKLFSKRFSASEPSAKRTASESVVRCLFDS